MKYAIIALEKFSTTARTRNIQTNSADKSHKILTFTDREISIIDSTLY